MYILYLDESGDENDPLNKHFVLAGAAIFERSTFFLSQDLDKVQSRYFPGGPPIDFHAAPMRLVKIAGGEYLGPIASKHWPTWRRSSLMLFRRVCFCLVQSSRRHQHGLATMR